MFCKKPNDHKMKNYIFCSSCGTSGMDEASSKPLKQIFYCELCIPAMKSKKHGAHTAKLIQLTDQAFLKKYQIFIDQLQQLTADLYFEKFDQSVSLGDTLKSLPNQPLFVMAVMEKECQNLISQEEYREWLVRGHFWQCEKGNNFMEKFKADIRKNFTVCEGPVEVVEPFKIKSLPDPDFIKQLEEAIMSTDQMLKQETSQVQLVEFYIKVFSSFRADECEKLIRKNDELLNKHPDEKPLYLSKIRLCQLVPQKNQEIEKVLIELIKVDPQFKDHELYSFYLAQSKWEIRDSAMEGEDEKIFKNLKNSLHYRLTDVKGYISLIEKCLKKNNKRPLFYSSLGIGQLLNKDMEAAKLNFQKAVKEAESTETLSNNKLWGQLHSPQKKYIDFKVLLEEAEMQSMHFIVNLCKFFKTKKLYPELLMCCEALCLREEDNVDLKVQEIKAKIKVVNPSETSESIEVSVKEFLDQACQTIEKMKEKSVAKAKYLEKRLLKLKGHRQWKQQNFQSANEEFSHAVKNSSRNTSTDWYNLAVCLFKTNEGENNEEVYRESLEAVEQALAMKQKEKYRKLRFFILCYLAEFGQAKGVCPEGLQEVIPGETYEDLRQFVDDNATA